MPCTALEDLRSTAALVQAIMQFNLLASVTRINYILSTEIDITETTHSCWICYEFGNQ
jgi:hypothetical protein